MKTKYDRNFNRKFFLRLFLVEILFLFFFSALILVCVPVGIACFSLQVVFMIVSIVYFLQFNRQNKKDIDN